MQQQELVAGTTLNFLTSVPDFPASAGWTLVYYLRLRSGSGGINIIATPEGDDYRVQVAAATTGGWTPGTYSWASRIEKTATGEKFEVNKGQIVIQPDITASSGTFDNRSALEIALANVDALLQGKATSGQRRYRIGDRELESYGATELLALRSRLVVELKRERRQRALEQGLPDPSKSYVRLIRE